MMVSVEFLMHHNLPCSLSINFCFYILIHDRIFQISFSCKTWNLMYCHLFPWENRLGRYKQIGSLIVTFVASSSCCLSCLENASARGVTSCEGWFCVPDWGLQAVFSFLPFLLLFFFCPFPFFSQKYDRSSVWKDFWTAFFLSSFPQPWLRTEDFWSVRLVWRVSWLAVGFFLPPLLQ